MVCSEQGISRQYGLDWQIGNKTGLDRYVRGFGSLGLVYRMQKEDTYIDEFRIIRTLGDGYHAIVKLAQDPHNNLVAIKKFKPETANLSTLKQELAVMKELHHDNLVNLIDVRENAEYKKPDGNTYTCFVIVLEYVSGGELFDYIAIGGRFTETVCRTYLFQLFNAVNYMHSKGFAHRDIKPENILVTAHNVLKLADFGFATLLEGKDHSGLLHTKLGTEGYMAPEISTKIYEGVKTDIFSCGVILFIMYTASPPFERAIPNDPFYRLIKEKNFEKFWTLHNKKRPADFFKPDFKDLIQRMLAYKPQERPSMVDISKHPWSKGEVAPVPSLTGEFQERRKKIANEITKQRQEKVKRKEARFAAIFNPNDKVTRADDSDIYNFKSNYEVQQSSKKELDTKKHIENCDYVIEENEDFVYTTLTTFLNKPVKLKTSEISMEYRPKYTREVNKFTIVYEFDHEDMEESVSFSLTVSKGKGGRVILTPKKISGQFIHYRRLKRVLLNEFCYCEYQGTSK